VGKKMHDALKEGPSLKKAWGFVENGGNVWESKEGVQRKGLAPAEEM